MYMVVLEYYNVKYGFLGPVYCILLCMYVITFL